MNYFDPSRPRICGRAAYVFDGRAVAPLPLFCVEPVPEGFCISFMLLHQDDGGSWYERVVPFANDVHAFLAKWLEDPESVLADLGWTYHLPRDEGPLEDDLDETLSLSDLED